MIETLALVGVPLRRDILVGRLLFIECENKQPSRSHQQTQKAMCLFSDNLSVPLPMSLNIFTQSQSGTVLKIYNSFVIQRFEFWHDASRLFYTTQISFRWVFETQIQIYFDILDLCTLISNTRLSPLTVNTRVHTCSVDVSALQNHLSGQHT